MPFKKASGRGVRKTRAIEKPNVSETAQNQENENLNNLKIDPIKKSKDTKKVQEESERSTNVSIYKAEKCTNENNIDKNNENELLDDHNYSTLCKNKAEDISEEEKETVVFKTRIGRKTKNGVQKAGAAETSRSFRKRKNITDDCSTKILEVSLIRNKRIDEMFYEQLKREKDYEKSVVVGEKKLKIAKTDVNVPEKSDFKQANVDEKVKDPHKTVDSKKKSKTSKKAKTHDEDLEKDCSKSTELPEKEKKDLIKTVAGGEQKTKAGKRAKTDDEDIEESGAKPTKLPKKESKGQSKKDKMPDVTLLDFGNSSTTSDGKIWNLKLSSWNVNGVRAWLEKDGLNFLKHEKPDVMCFQETKCSDKQLPEAVNVEGYHSYWLAGDKDGYSGVGLLSKIKPISVKYGIGVEEHDKEGRVITAEYEKFYLVTAYVPNAGRGLVRLTYRTKWDEDFRSYLKDLDEKKPVVLCGDLNVSHEEIDLANPKTNKKNAGFTKEEREGFSALLAEGFIDSFRYLYPEQKAAYTFWTYMMNCRAKNVGWRLDYFILSKRFVDHLCDNVIRKDVFGSDHCPITLFLSV